MALETTSIALDADVVSEIAGAVADNSTIARLSPIKPMLFNDEKYLVFNGASEAEVVAEGAKKGSYEQSFSDPIIAQRYTIQTTTRVSDQLRWADEDDRLKIVESIIEDQRAAIGRAIDYIVYHAVSRSPVPPSPAPRRSPPPPSWSRRRPATPQPTCSTPSRRSSSTTT